MDKRTAQTSQKQPTITLALRPDVANLVADLIVLDKSLTDPVCWRAYSSAKHQVSRLCGWDASPDQYDQRQYELAMQTYIEGCGL